MCQYLRKQESRLPWPAPWVIPAQAGTQKKHWTAAFAGMTIKNPLTPNTVSHPASVWRRPLDGQGRGELLHSAEVFQAKECSGTGRSGFQQVGVMEDFVQQRHKPPLPLERPRELILACPPMRSNVNLARIVRAAGCCKIQRIICAGHPRIIRKIARDASQYVPLEYHRTLPPVLRRLRQEGYELVGLEQTTGSILLPKFSFQRKTVLVIGNERTGLDEEILQLVDHVVEIPVYGLPYAHNVATAAAIALYEYCRQYPDG